MSAAFTARRSIFARIVLSAIATALVVTLGLWLLTDTTIERTNRVALERSVDVDIAGLVDIFASGGRDELVRRIDDRLALHPAGDDGEVHYMLATDAGKRIAGDVTRWPPLQPRLSEAGYVKLAGGERAYARATELGPDLRLLVAHEGHETARLRQRIGFVFLGGGLLAAIAVAIAGIFAARRLSGRIDRINAAFRAPDAEALQALTARAAGGDEIDELARHSGNALARLDRLATAHRDTSNRIAHEMRTPLMHLDTRLARALAARPDTETAQLIADSRGEIRGIVRMLESVLDIAASEARRGDRHGLAPVDLSALALRLADLYADSAEESGHRFDVEIEPGVTLEGEETQLTRLVTNLLDNAFKYVPGGRTVWLKVAKGPALTVADNGPGIPEAERETIFESFHRGGSRPGEQGAGLGLALCRAIAERHGLEIALVPTEQGACFIVSPQVKP